MELLLQERGYETAFEGKRYCDLKRCGKLAEYAVRAAVSRPNRRWGPQPTGGPYPPTNSTTTHHSIRPRIKTPDIDRQTIMKKALIYFTIALFTAASCGKETPAPAQRWSRSAPTPGMRNRSGP